jgi:hypothetical protein
LRLRRPIARHRLHWRHGGGIIGLSDGRQSAGSRLGASLKLPQALFELPVAVLQLFVLAGELPQLIFKPLNADLGVDIVGLRQGQRAQGLRAQTEHRGQRRSARNFMKSG